MKTGHILSKIGLQNATLSRSHFSDLGANGELTLNCERTLLMVAACRASPSVVELVADTYPKQLGATDINRDSVLVTTLTHNRHEVLETLLRTDQNVNELDYDAALMKAIDLGGRTKSGLLLVPKVGFRRTILQSSSSFLLY